jgi:3-hydroxy acid dehydrogenase/malonic semialdehyde reductase
MTSNIITSFLNDPEIPFPLKDKKALVTGASSGIGLATSIFLAKEGTHLVLVARRKEQLLQIQNELKEQFPEVNVEIIPLDLLKNNAVEELKKLNALNVDIFINNAGISRTRDFVIDLLHEDIDEVITTNLNIAFKLSAAVAKNMVQNGSGHIVHLGSVAGNYTYEGGSVYCATKSAMKAFSTTMRQELYDKNIRVTLVSPGIVKTNFSVVRFKGDKEKADKVYEGLDCLKPSDVARLIITTLKEPSHVNLDEIVILPTAQAPGTNKTKRK